MSLGVLAQAAPARPAFARRAIPFDYAFRFDFRDPSDEEPESFVDRLFSQTVTISIEAAFTAVSIGYGLLPQVKRFAFGPGPEETEEEETKNIPFQIRLGTVFESLSRALKEMDFVERRRVGPRTASVLTGGFRLNPEVVKTMLLGEGREPLEADELEELFETLDLPPEGVLFLFALHDEATGRAFQSEPLLNIAGLGIADGDRPFRHFAQPIMFAPQTQIRLDVVPKSEFKGELHVVLHGYKVLGGAGSPTGRAGRRRTRRSR